MRQIFPARAGAGKLLGPADPLGAAGPITPAAPGAADDLVAALADVYAFPDRLWVRANMIASVDGAVALDGRSGGLSGAADRLVFTVLRSLADVIVVGAGTARAELYRQAQPAELWQQLRPGRPPAPPVAVITRRLRLDLGSRLFGPCDQGRSGSPGPRPSQAANAGTGLARTIVLTTELAPADRLAAAARVADVVVVGADSVTATAAIETLAGRGYRRILVEGGPTLLGQFAAEGLLDELCLTISPLLEGGHAADRMTSRRGPAEVTGLRLQTLLEDGGFLLSRYVRA